MKEAEQKAAAKAFSTGWQGKGYEKGETQPFWLSLLRDVYGVEQPENFIFFEGKVQLGHASFIDATIPETHVMIEQKSLGKDLSKPIKQSDGTFLTPYQQAKRYAAEIPYSKRPRWIVACNFSEFRVYDMENPQSEPEIVLLENLPKEYYRLQFLVNAADRNIKKEMELSIAAGEIVGKLYDAIRKQYKEPDSEEAQKSLNKLCVRLVFCLYAEDAGIFGKRNMFHDYLYVFRERNVRQALINLFEVLSTPTDERDPYMDAELAAFPYVNGGLFDDSRTDLQRQIPQLTEEILGLLLKNASTDFDWSGISPTIFGAVFESTLNPETRRKGGMHYTSIPNIHKVIDPLFLDELKREFEEVKSVKTLKLRRQKLFDFQQKLASLTFLDSSCGSGNFLTESYISLRRLENDILKEIHGSNMMLDFGENFNPIKVSIGQFYGIEINDFAVTVSKTALWIAESQAMQETENIVHKNLDFLPLKSYTNIIEGNALYMDWGSVVPKEQLNYIIGNPPFVGFTFQSQEQKADMQKLFPKVKNLDYVCAWYKIASDFIQGTTIECSFVSTNSITQGETAARLWPFLHVKINFAHRTFQWNSESNEKAHVHCVILGFAAFDRPQKYIYQDSHAIAARNINAYLLDAPDLLVTSRNTPICDVPKMIYGNKPADGGNLIIEDKDLAEFLKKEPQDKKFIRPLLGAEEYIHGKKRWCLWLVDASPAELKKCPLILERIRKCQEKRAGSIAKGIQKFAETPTLFAQITQPEGVDFIIVPLTTSERRKYIPMGFMSKEVKVTNLVSIIPDAGVYELGILSSNVHIAWMRAVAGRLKSDYRYSKDVVYNNFPWPSPTQKQRETIEKTAQGILDARANHADSTLADLYDEALMPPDLRKAHQANDRAVMATYGFDVGSMTEASCVAELMRMYQALVERG